MNEKVLSTLEFHKITDILKTHLSSDIGLEYALQLKPVSSLDEVEQLLTQTEEADGIYRRTGRTPIESFPDMREALRRIHAALALSAGELLNVARCLAVSRSARDTLQAGEPEGLLCLMANRLSSHRSIEEEIGRCILSEDEISDNASPELSRIRRQIRLTNDRVKDKLNSLIKSSANQQYLQEPIITVRNGRYALPVKSEHRNRIPGLIHDQSGSGQTLFIEPAAVVELGNDLRRLQAEERREITRILASLTAQVEPVASELLTSMELMGRLDVIFAKAVMARDMRAIRPKMNAESKIHIENGRHPLLDAATVVPINIWLGERFRTLIITGPNTGGKTVTLKTVGLMCLMAMSGMFVPADEGTFLSVFQEVFADIGDEQSIEQSLSTFSSHMRNNVGILNRADGHALVLLDELGAGTDPVEGAALAQAILETLYDRGALTLATTHYSEIKAFALTHEGMQNASMEFDVDRLCPTFRLYIGIPGKSNAFEIARRLGLDDEIIALAGDYLEKKDIAFEDVLTSAEEARREAAEAMEAAKRERWESERIRSELETEKKKLEDEKAVLRAKARDDARRLVNQTRSEMEGLIRELRSIKDIDTKALERAVQNSRDAMRRHEEKLAEQRAKIADNLDAPSFVKVGDRVHVLSVDKDASVVQAPDAKGDALVQAGIIKFTANLSDMRLIVPKTKKGEAAARVAVGPPAQGAVLELDLRGKLVNEAEAEIDRSIEEHLMAGIKEFSIIHGKGTGALRAGVQAYLKHDGRVKAFRMGAYGEGDAGVTVVTLK